MTAGTFSARYCLEIATSICSLQSAEGRARPRELRRLCAETAAWLLRAGARALLAHVLAPDQHAPTEAENCWPSWLPACAAPDNGAPPSPMPSPARPSLSPPELPALAEPATAGSPPQPAPASRGLTTDGGGGGGGGGGGSGGGWLGVGPGAPSYELRARALLTLQVRRDHRPTWSLGEVH